MNPDPSKSPLGKGGIKGGKKLLLTGASGFLGWNICREAYKEWEITGTVFTHPVRIKGIKIIQTDLTRFREFKKIFKEIGPDAVIHTAALSSPDYCQKHKSGTRKINVDVPVYIAGLCADAGIPFVFTSSDLVFDGFNAPYKEDDPVGPVNLYGEQKVLAEEGVMKRYPGAAVCRMPLMFGDPGPAASSFFQTMLTAFRNGSELRLFEDEYRTPVSGRTAARGLLIAIEKMNGLVHLGGRERISRYNFGLLMMGVLGARHAKLIRCCQKDLTMAASRPPDISLDSSKAYSIGFNPLTLKNQLEELLVKTTRPKGALG
ncbi:MAG: NAD(P)-dependent oxidoreductase [Nitrospiraceae bacterium]|nr:MAG: NAD(P)-dependent oxidoreductase [Nitrospiraceae bacterium]